MAGYGRGKAGTKGLSEVEKAQQWGVRVLDRFGMEVRGGNLRRGHFEGLGKRGHLGSERGIGIRVLEKQSIV